jgi:hypothetical protein
MNGGSNGFGGRRTKRIEESDGCGLLEDRGEGGADGGLVGGGLAADNGSIAADEAEGVLIEDGRHGFIKFGQLVTELDGTFEENLDGDGPEFVVIDCGVVTEQVLCTALLHGGEYGAGHFGEVGELLFKMTVFFGLGDEVDIREGVRHFVEADVAIGGLLGDPFHKIVPGEIDPGLVYMAHKGAGVESIMIVIPEDEDIVEVIEFEFFEAKGQLDGDGADEDGHFRGLFHFDIPEVLGVLEEPGTKQKFSLLLQTQPVIVGQVARDNRVIEGLSYNKSLKLVPVIKALNKQRNGAVQQKSTQYQ